jgi:hypothetical protein
MKRREREAGEEKVGKESERGEVRKGYIIKG